MHQSFVDTSVAALKWFKASAGVKIVKDFCHKLEDPSFIEPGLVVMGGDACSEGRGFESEYRLFHGI